MVSSVLASVLQSYLGQYLELSESSISVGSEVKLNNVLLKESALSDLGLPVRCVHGKVSRLVIKIPWFSLFTQKTVIYLEGLHLLVVPSTAVKYDEQKEKREANEAKQKRLERAEQAKEFGKEEKKENNEEGGDTFAERLVANIIRNLEVTITSVHLRYEDQTSSGRYPFAAGVTLDSIYLSTVADLMDSGGKVQLKVFKKHVQLNSFALYWRPKAGLYSANDSNNRVVDDAIDHLFDSTIGTKEKPCSKLKYLLGPISSEASLQWCPNPANFQFQYPELDLVIDMDQLCLSLTKYQYQDFIMLLQSFEFISRGSKFRKYKARNNLENLPNYNGRLKDLWKFAFDCIYEEEVARKLENWSWNHMKEHINKCKSYRALYKEKLSTSKPSDSLKKKLRAYEDNLDEVNIRIQRQLAEREVEKIIKEKAETAKSGFWGWWSGSPKKEVDNSSPVANNIKMFSEALTVEDKSKLYEVLDYQENAHHGIFPKSFEARKLNFNLANFVIDIKDDDLNDAKVLQVDLETVTVDLRQRPSADYLQVEMSMHSLTVTGFAKSGPLPRIVKTRRCDDGEGNLVSFSFENHPPSNPKGDLDKDEGSLYDQRIKFLSSPLEITYDASTFWRMLMIFKTPDDLNLASLQESAATQLKEIRSTTTLGLQYVIENHNLVDIDVHLMSSYIVIPLNGKLDNKSTACAVANLGSITIKSKPISAETRDLRNISLTDLTEAFKKSLRDQAYDKFNISLENMQLLVALPQEDWRHHVTKSVSPLFLLKPTSLNISFQYCLIKHDPEMPLTKVGGSLEEIVINISDYRLNKLAKILDSLMEYEEEEANLHRTESEESMQSALSSLANTGSMIQTPMVAPITDIEIAKKESVISTEGPLVNEIKSVIKFAIGNVDLSLTQLKPNTNEDEKIFHFSIYQLEMNTTIRSFDLVGKFDLGGLTCEHLLLRSLSNEPVNLIKTDTEKTGESLLSITYTDVKKTSPDFHRVYDGVLKKLDVRMNSVFVNFHQDAVLDIIEKITKFVLEVSSNAKHLLASPGKIDATQKTEERPANVTVGEDEPDTIEPSVQLRRQNARRTSTRRKASVRGPVNLARWAFKAKKKVSLKQEEVELKVVARMKGVTLDFMTSKVYLANLQVKNLKASYVETKTEKTIKARLVDFKIIDPVNSLHEKPKTFYEVIAESVDQRVFDATITLYNTTAVMKVDNPDVVDVCVEASMGKVKVVFLMKFINDLLAFLDPFTGAKEAMVERASLAFEGATTAMINAYANATRAQLDIRMEAPLIIIPVHSTSTTTFMANLGTLRLTNRFVIEGQHIFDCMHFNMNDLILSRAKINEDYLSNDVEASCLVIHPITFELDVKRSMNGAKKKGDPAEIKASGTLHEINVQLSKNDYDVILAVLMNNFSEQGSFEKSKETPKSSVKPITSQGKSKSSVSISSQKSIQLQEALKVNERDQDARAVEFDIKLLGFSANLFSGDSPLQKVDDERQMSSALAKVEVKLIKVDGYLLVSSAVKAKLELENFVLEDNRVHDNVPSNTSRIVRLMEAKKTKGKGSPRMIDIDYSKTAEGDQNVDVTIHSFVLVGSVSYLLEIANFFVQDQTLNYEWQVAEVSREASTDTPNKMSVFLQIEEPDIFLIENIEDINSDALMLNTELQFKLIMSDGQMSIISSLTNIRCHTCRFNPELREESLAQILQPCTLSFSVSQTDGHGMRVNANVSDFCLNVSPHSIIIIQNSIQAFLDSMAQKKELEKSKENNKVANFANLWETKAVKEDDFWFLKPDESIDALDLLGASEKNDIVQVDEQAIVNINNFVIKIESGLGNNTIPLLLLESSFNCDVRNWSSPKMSLIGSMDLEVAYYNSRLALWEPVIEPVCQIKPDGGELKKRWDLNITIQCNSPDDYGSELTSPDDTDGFVSTELLPPLMLISIQSKEILEMTVTKSCLAVLNTLSESFGSVTSTTKKKLPASPFIVENTCGKTVTILLECRGFKYFLKDDKPGRIPQVEVKHGETIHLFVFRDRASDNYMYVSPLQEQSDSSEMTLKLRVGGEKGIFEIPVSRADKRFFPFPYRGDERGDTHGMVSEINVNNGCKFITLRTIIQVKNHFQQAVNLFVYDGSSKYIKLAKLEPDDSFNVPIQNVYSPPYEFYFQIDDPAANMGIQSFDWRLMADEEPSHHEQILCTFRDGGPDTYLMVQGMREDIFLEKSLKRSCMAFVIDVRPMLVLKNCLPIVFSYVNHDSQVVDIEVGGTGHLQGVTVDATEVKLKLKNFRGIDWDSVQVIKKTMPDLATWRFTAKDAYGNPKKLDISLNTITSNGTIVLSAYAQFWMVNKTGKDLTYKGQDPQNVVEHTAAMNEMPMIFSYLGKGFMGNRKVSVKVGDSTWSEPFTLDTIEDGGKITCRWADGAKKGSFHVGVNIAMSKSSLTKIVTFTPYHIILNTTSHSLMVLEQNCEAEVLQVPPGECVAFWPITTAKELKASVQDTTEWTSNFSMTSTKSTLLKLDNHHGGLNAECKLSGSECLLTLSPYTKGLAPALLVNSTKNCMIEYMEMGDAKEKGNKAKKYIGPSECALFTWERPSGVRKLVWYISGYSDEYLNQLISDGEGVIELDQDKYFGWVSFLDGMQRVLLFTDDISLCYRLAHSTGENERISQELEISIHGIGISIVNNSPNCNYELIYTSVTSSDIVWEVKRSGKSRYKMLTRAQCDALETDFQVYLREKSVGKRTSDARVITVMGSKDIHVNYFESTMSQPLEGKVRRQFQKGFWLQVRSSPHQQQIHAKINRIQIDNQLSHCLFPVIMAPVPPPKSVVAESIPKPFIELSVLEYKSPEHSNLHQFKYIHALVQELHIKIDQGLLNAIMDLFEEEEILDENIHAFLSEDLKFVKKPLQDIARLKVSKGTKDFFDFLHFSPLKVHISFSLTSYQSSKINETRRSTFFGHFLQSLGVTITGTDDIIFRLAYFERRHNFYSSEELLNEMMRHYTSQAIKQAYVVIFGLDVIGNPYGLMVGVSRSVEDLFYEPFQGAVEGPSEFAEGLVIGVRSVFSGVVGGAAGTVSRITGALGKGLASITFDEKFQSKRRETIKKRGRQTVGEGLARSGKGLVMGFVDGVTGVALKPIEGAKDEGVGGFFKGVGKGVVGLVARPTGGLVDFASGTFDTVKRVTEVSEEIERIRPVRFLHSDGVVRNFNLQEALGSKILNNLEKGRYSESDNYVAHFDITADRPSVLLISSRRILFVTYAQMMGTWTIDWEFEYGAITGPPPTGKDELNGVPQWYIIIKPVDEKKKVFGLFGGTERGKKVFMPNRESAQKCARIIEDLRISPN